MLVARVYLLEQSGKHARDDASVFVIGLRSGHGEGLAGPRLPIAEHAARIAIESSSKYLLGSKIEDNILRSIGEHFLKLEPPLVLLMVNYPLVQRPVHIDIDLSTDIKAKGTPSTHQLAYSYARSWRSAASG